jgi:hypothetical protein
VKALVVLALVACASCAGISRGERARYAVEGIRAACVINSSYPDEVPDEAKLELDEICPVLKGAP